MRGIETIALDARVVSVIKEQIFRAQLANGHAFTAFVGRTGGTTAIRIGDRVAVALSPYDMSRGRIVMKGEGEHESA